MNWSLLPAVLLSLLAGLFSLILALFAWRRTKHSKVVRPFMLFSLGIGIWSISYGLEIFNTSLENKLFWSNLQFFGVGLIPPAFLAFTLYYTNREQWLRRPVRFLLAVEPLVTLALVYTNPIHQIILGFSEQMAQDATLSATQRTNLETIGHSGKRLLGLINDLLELSKWESPYE